MALKDWKKETGISGGKIMFTKRDEDTLHDFIDVVISKEVGHFLVSVYSDSGTNSDFEDIFEKFKTKSAALKFAKSYMRTH